MFPKPYIYLHYVDDTFACCCTHNEALSFFLQLTFTIDEEKDIKLLFLDELVERRSFAFVTSIYRKSTFTDLYLSRDAFAPKSTKVNLLKCLTFRALKICLYNKIKSEFEQIKIYFWVTGILRKPFLTPLTKLFISLGITSGHLALLNVQFIFDFLGLDLLAS